MLLIHDDQRLIELKGCFSLTHMNMFKCLHIYWQPIQDVLVLSAICQLNTDNTWLEPLSLAKHTAVASGLYTERQIRTRPMC